jgi:hypothetical protein
MERLWAFVGCLPATPVFRAKEACMKTIFKIVTAAALTGALALAVATPSQARDGRNAAAAIGFGAGALVGAAVVNSNNGYYGGPGGYYGPTYYSEPGYAYAPEPVYEHGPPRRAYRGGGGCWVVTDSSRGYGYYGAC